MNVKELKRQAKNALTTSEPIKAMTQQMLNMMIAAEFESLIGATKYERYKDIYPAAMRAFYFDVMNTLTFLNFKDIPSRLITTSNRIERLNLELRRRAKLVGTFANVESCLRLNTLVCMEYISKVGIYAPSFIPSQTDDIL